jgi:hypothetical protein
LMDDEPELMTSTVPSLTLALPVPELP